MPGRAAIPNRPLQRVRRTPEGGRRSHWSPRTTTRIHQRRTASEAGGAVDPGGTTRGTRCKDAGSRTARNARRPHRQGCRSKSGPVFVPGSMSTGERLGAWNRPNSVARADGLAPTGRTSISIRDYGQGRCARNAGVLKLIAHDRSFGRRMGHARISRRLSINVDPRTRRRGRARPASRCAVR